MKHIIYRDIYISIYRSGSETKHTLWYTNHNKMMEK